MEKKYVETGVFSSITTVTKSITPKNFSELLKGGHLILDRNFKNQLHGELVHLLQIDLLNFIAKKNQMTTGDVANFYRWMGKNNPILLEKGLIFEPVQHTWNSLFDSFEPTLAKPENLNPVLLKALGIK